MFEELKNYLDMTPLLSKSELGEELYIYLVVSLVAISLMLVYEKCKVQRPIYYVNKIFHDAKVRYSRLEKLIYALIILA